MCSVSTNIDHGGIPALTKSLKEELDIGNQGLGMLGSLVFFGLVLGSISATFLFDRIKYRTLLSLSFFGNSIGLLLFGYAKYFPIVCFSRLLTGVCQVSSTNFRLLMLFFRLFVRFMSPYMWILTTQRRVKSGGCLPCYLHHLLESFLGIA